MALNDLRRNCGIATVLSIVSSLFSAYDYFVSMFSTPFTTLLIEIIDNNWMVYVYLPGLHELIDG
jgi:hypothetical protein